MFEGTIDKQNLNYGIANTSGAVENIILILIGVMPVFLLTNKFSYGSIAVMLLLSVVSIIYFFKGTPLNIYHSRAIILLTITGSYFLFSYLISNQSIRNLFSFGFLRYDGSFFFCYLAFFIFAVGFVNYEKALKIYFTVLFLVFVIFGILGIFEYINNEQFFNVRIDDYYLGPIFTALNQAHNATGSVYAVVGVAAAAFFLESNEKSPKIYYASTFIIIVIALLITKSRGSFAGFVAGAVFVFLLSSKSLLKLLRNTGILIAALAAIVFITGTYNRILQMVSFSDASAINRFELWDKAITLIKTSPLTGIGFARYNDVAWDYSALPLYKYAPFISIYNKGGAVFNTTNAHNSYLGLMSETGIIGLILMMVFWVFIFYIFIKAYRKEKGIFAKQVFLSISGFIAALFILSISENYMTAPTLMLLLSVTISLAIGYLSVCETRGNFNSKDKNKLEP